MKPYNQLTRIGRLRRIRKLATTALDIYGMTGARLCFLRYFANITYRVDVQAPVKCSEASGPYLPSCYMLRVLLADHWDYAMGEMTWLAALSSEGGMPVPSPVPTQDGDLLARITTPGVPQGRIVSLMRWVDGRKFTTGYLADHFFAWGQMVARLHAFAAGWMPPDGFERYVWDWEGLLGGRGFGYLDIEELVVSMPRHLQEPFRIISGEARLVMDALGKDLDAYGMVHGDMYQENVLVKGSELYPIDFEDCGYGYWLWDIAVALSKEPWTEAWKRQRDVFLDGYTRVHPLPDKQLQHLDLFLAINFATGVLWASSFLRDEPTRRNEHEAWRDENGTMLLRYLEQRGTK